MSQPSFDNVAGPRRQRSLKQEGTSRTGTLLKRLSMQNMASMLHNIRTRDILSGMGFIYKKTAEWGSHFPEANGTNQSPININSNEAVYEEGPRVGELRFSYVSCRELGVYNNGHTVVVCLHHKPLSESVLRSDTTVPRSVMTGWPGAGRGEDMELSEMRFHWGKEGTRGSEHTVNCKAFPMEIHLIHFNASKYESLEEALGNAGGVLIIALFVQVGQDHPGLRVITDNLPDIQYKGQQKTANCPFNPSCLLPDVMLRDFWTYEGSLTSPPCNEQVTWILFRYPLMIAEAQIEEFRRLRSHRKGETSIGDLDGQLADNFRPTQPINERVVWSSFPQ